MVARSRTGRAAAPVPTPLARARGCSSTFERGQADHSGEDSSFEPAMRKGAAVGTGPALERWPSSDPRSPGATLLPAPPRCVGLRTLVLATVLRQRGLASGTVGVGSAAGSGRGLAGMVVLRGV